MLSLCPPLSGPIHSPIHGRMCQGGNRKAKLEMKMFLAIDDEGDINRNFVPSNFWWVHMCTNTKAWVWSQRRELMDIGMSQSKPVHIQECCSSIWCSRNRNKSDLYEGQTSSTHTCASRVGTNQQNRTGSDPVLQSTTRKRHRQH